MAEEKNDTTVIVNAKKKCLKCSTSYPIVSKHTHCVKCGSFLYVVQQIISD